MLEKIANYFLIGACIACMVAMGAYAKRRFAGPPARITASSEPEFKVGQSAAKIGGIDLAKPTLVLGLSPTCSFCKRDIPMYRQLARTKKVTDGSVRVVTILPPASQSAQFATENQLPGTIRVVGDVKDYPFHATPSILLLDEKHVVVWTWRGSLTPDAMNDLKTRLGSNPG